MGDPVKMYINNKSFTECQKDLSDTDYNNCIHSLNTINNGIPSDYVNHNPAIGSLLYSKDEEYEPNLNSDELEQYYTSLNYGKCVSIPDIKNINTVMQNESDYCTKFGNTYYPKLSNYVKCNNNDEYRVQCFNNLKRVRVSPPVQDVQEDFTINLRKNKIVSIILLICLLVFVQVCMSS